MKASNLKELDASFTRNDELVDQLEKLLAQAKSGELIAYAGAFQWRGMRWSTGWSIGESKEASGLHLQGTLANLQWEIARAKNEP